MQGKIIYNGNVDGLDILIRYPQDGDASAMCNYINNLSQEKTYITYQGEKISLTSEEKYVKKQLVAFKNHKSAQLLLFVNSKLSGITSVDMLDKIKKHIGVFGISILKEYRGMGFGKLLMKYVLDEAIKNLNGLRIITLEVFAENEKSVKMYKNFEFVEYGHLPEGNSYKDKFVDDISMFKKIKNGFCHSK